MKLTFKHLLPALLVALLGVQAMANTVTIYQNTKMYSGANGGGEFMAVSPSLVNNNYAANVIYPSPGSGLQVFCLESSVLFYPGTTYNYQLDTVAMPGSSVITPGPDALSKGSAWLYQQFASGTLAGYNYSFGSGRTASATLLQNAFWILENQPAEGTYTGAYDASNPFEAMVVAQFGSLANAQADATLADLGHVRVMNLYTGSLDRPNWVQAQIVLVPDAAGTLVLLGVSLLGLSFIRRRKAA